MTRVIFLCALLAVSWAITSCSNPEMESKENVWIVNALGVHVQELDSQNTELDRILFKMNPGHHSIRSHTRKLVDRLEEVKMLIVKRFSGENKTEIKGYHRLNSKGHVYPMTFTFQHKEIPKNLALLVKEVIESFDNHPRTNGKLYEKLRTVLPTIFEYERFSKLSFFDGLTIAESIELLEFVETNLLVEESKYQISQFDRALNVRIIYSANDN